MEFTVEQVQRAANGDEAEYTRIFNYFFEERVEGWLINKGIVDEAERADWIEELIWAFYKQLPKYKDSRLKFEVVMWKEFHNCFLNYAKKLGRIREREDCLNGTTVKFHTGCIDGDVDLGVDIEIIRRGLTGNTKTVFEAMVIGMQRKDMKSINLNEQVWDSERDKLRKELVQYGYGI